MLLSWLVDKYNVVFLKGVEADDTARIVFEDNDNFPGEKVIVSVDKDFYSVPCNFTETIQTEEKLSQSQKKMLDKIYLFKSLLGINLTDIADAKESAPLQLVAWSTIRQQLTI